MAPRSVLPAEKWAKGEIAAQAPRGSQHVIMRKPTRYNKVNRLRLIPAGRRWRGPAIRVKGEYGEARSRDLGVSRPRTSLGSPRPPAGGKPGHAGGAGGAARELSPPARQRRTQYLPRPAGLRPRHGRPCHRGHLQRPAASAQGDPAPHLRGAAAGLPRGCHLSPVYDGAPHPRFAPGAGRAGRGASPQRRGPARLGRRPATPPPDVLLHGVLGASAVLSGPGGRRDRGDRPPAPQRPKGRLHRFGSGLRLRPPPVPHGHPPGRAAPALPGLTGDLATGDAHVPARGQVAGLPHGVVLRVRHGISGAPVSGDADRPSSRGG